MPTPQGSCRASYRSGVSLTVLQGLGNLFLHLRRQSKECWQSCGRVGAEVAVGGDQNALLSLGELEHVGVPGVLHPDLAKVADVMASARR